MTILITLKNDKEIYIHSLKIVKTIKEQISEVLNNNSSHIHFQSDTFDRDLIIMKDEIRTIEYFE